ncbi:MAG: tRNA lysidine(34) synthetase TilS [Bacteroidales bacterium]|jgi:tRNA(Ile)-lysidine synthase|nr:tRNA lysidine(34) synthetase TilS [Bacteroidales bacterium]
MREKFYQELLHLAPNAQSARFLLAVSGGRDSIVLAHLFTKCNLFFDIAHCNFHLRGEESDKEMVFVQNIPFLSSQKVFVKEFDTFAIQKNSGKSIEMIARELRYQWFEEIGEDYYYLVTAHHANDNAETILINLLRGTGLRGMQGIAPKNGKIIRPLLKFPSYLIEKYCIEQDLEFCLDSSNLKDEFLRNKIRHNIIPELEKIKPNFIDTFTKNCSTFKQQTQFLDSQIQHYKNQIWIEKDNRITINIDALKDTPFYSIILFEILNPLGFNSDDVENILKSCDSHSGKRFLSHTYSLVKDRNSLVIEMIEEKNEDEIIIHSIEEFEKYGFIIKKKRNNSNLNITANPKLILIDVAKLIFPLSIRSWKKGDSFYPFGMKTKKKLSNFFTDLKIDIFKKQKIRILCSNNEIVWIINYRADNRFRVDEHTEWYYELRSQNLEAMPK